MNFSKNLELLSVFFVIFSIYASSGYAQVSPGILDCYQINSQVNQDRSFLMISRELNGDCEYGFNNLKHNFLLRNLQLDNAKPSIRSLYSAFSHQAALREIPNQIPDESSGYGTYKIRGNYDVTDNGVVSFLSNIFAGGMTNVPYSYDITISADNKITVYTSVAFSNQNLFVPNVFQELSAKLESASQFWTDKFYNLSFLQGENGVGYTSDGGFQIEYKFAYESDISKAHLVVGELTINPSAGPYDRVWSTQWNQFTINHEVGHLLGLLDEYRYSYPPSQADLEVCKDASSIMCMPNFDPLLYHYFIPLNRRFNPKSVAEFIPNGSVPSNISRAMPNNSLVNVSLEVKNFIPNAKNECRSLESNYLVECYTRSIEVQIANFCNKPNVPNDCIAQSKQALLAISQNTSSVASGQNNSTSQGSVLPFGDKPQNNTNNSSGVLVDQNYCNTNHYSDGQYSSCMKFDRRSVAEWFEWLQSLGVSAPSLQRTNNHNSQNIGSQNQSQVGSVNSSNQYVDQNYCGSYIDNARIYDYCMNRAQRMPVSKFLELIKE